MKYLYLLLSVLGLTLLTSTFDPALSVCGVDGVFDCGAVITSDYAAPLGIPLALLLFIFGVTGFLRSKHKDFTLLVLNSLGLIGVLYSLFVMAFILKTFCPLCLVADALIGLVFILWFRKPNLEVAPGISKDLALAVIISVFTFVFFHLQYHPKNQLQGEKITLLSSPLVLGNLSSQREVVVFTDFQCPACKKSSEVVKALLEKTDVKIVVKNYPLSSSCNNGVSSVVHGWACEAAKLSYCANEQGLFKEFYEIIYSLQDQIKKPDDIYEILQVGPFDVEELKACAGSDAASDFIKKDIAEGNRIHIEGTPTFYFQGQKVPSWRNAYLWKNLLNLD